MTLGSVGRTLLVFGLGTLAGAVLPEPSRAQVPVGRDTVRTRAAGPSAGGALNAG